MLTQLRALWQRVNASYWFYPALFTLGAVAMSPFTLWLDRNGAAGWLRDWELIRPARPQGATDVLTVISGSMIGVASTVFSITIAAVAYASGTYGPRLLNNFMEDRGNQLSLGAFIGTFVYAIMVLQAVREEEEEAGLLAQAAASAAQPGFVPQLSLLVAFLLMGVSVAVLVYFLNHVPASIRINTVLEGIGTRLLKGIDKYYPDPDRSAPAARRPEGFPVLSTEAGYVQLIDFESLKDVAGKRNGRIVMALRTGDFIHSGLPLAFWSPSGEAGNDDRERDRVAARIRERVALGSMRTPHQDLQFLIDELVEIGMRALSPGVNDPFTAITALHWLGAATARLGHRELRLQLADPAPGDEPQVFPVDDDYEHFLARGFGAIRGSVATSRIATQKMFDALADAAALLGNAGRREALRREGEFLIEQARHHLSGPELELAEARHAWFLRKMVV